MITKQIRLRTLTKVTRPQDRLAAALLQRKALGAPASGNTKILGARPESEVLSSRRPQDRLAAALLQRKALGAPASGNTLYTPLFAFLASVHLLLRNCNSFHIPLFPVCPREDFKMKFLIYFVLGFMSSTPGKASCPGRYESVSYQLGSERKESCYFVSTDYIKWEDGGYFCARHHGGYLAEFVYQAEWEAFKTFFANIPNATKWQLYDRHVWIGAGTTDGKVWRWNGSGEDFSQIVPRSQIPKLEKTPLIHFSVNESYGLTVNVYSGEW
ncbi:unnamed protein product, partial [Cyprideis torosa]